MIATSNYVTSDTVDTTGYYESRPTKKYVCNSTTCGCYCSGSCRSVSSVVQEKDEESREERETELSKKEKIHCPLELPIIQQYREGIAAKHFMSSRKGVTSKKIKMWSN